MGVEFERQRFEQRGLVHRLHAARGAEDRDAADDAEPRVEGALRDLPPQRRGNGDLRAARADHLAHRALDHRARHWVDRRFADGDLEPRQRHRADALPREEEYSPRLRQEFHGGLYQYSVGRIGVVARVLDHAAATVAVSDDRQGKFPLLRRRDLHAFGAGQPERAHRRGLRRRRRAASR
ncbi:hypothetical protein SDC9_121023 [bioreactor metagenome]|uniref:Uncharacterized protein n=1 Tax=bioreactor metagenome TaxID=1076179 RepID=A0A645CAW4_9ZZZZ